MNFEEYLNLGNQMLKRIDSKQFCYSAKIVDEFKKQYLRNVEKISRSNIVPDFRYCVDNITEAYIMQNKFEIFVEDSICLPQDYMISNGIKKVSNVFEVFSIIYSKKAEGKIAVIPGSKESFDFIMGINRLMFDSPAIPMFKASVFSAVKGHSSNNKQMHPMNQTTIRKAVNTPTNNTVLKGWESLD